jgi:hypothetical protein
MVDSTDYRKPEFLGAEFNDFLFASIGSDSSGTYLTVVSALARLDFDPWVEAASLARLPGGIATQKLAELVSRFSEIPSVASESAEIARRLTALLPGRIRSKIPAPKLPVLALHPTVQALIAPRFVLSLVFITVAVMLATQAILPQFHSTAKLENTVRTVASTNAQTKMPLGGSSDTKKTGN